MALYRISDLNVEIKTKSPTLAGNIQRYEVTYQANPNIKIGRASCRERVSSPV